MDRNKGKEILNKFGHIRLKIIEDKISYGTKNKTYEMWGYIVSKKTKIHKQIF
jgi:hypothetical protein